MLGKIQENFEIFNCKNDANRNFSKNVPCSVVIYLSGWSICFFASWARAWNTFTRIFTLKSHGFALSIVASVRRLKILHDAVHFKQILSNSICVWTNCVQNNCETTLSIATNSNLNSETRFINSVAVRIHWVTVLRAVLRFSEMSLFIFLSYNA